jgi:hypothetical protein
MKKIKGTVHYQSLGPGFWGIEDNKGGQWRPVEMPEALQHEGLAVIVRAKVLKDEVSIFMWGQAIEIVNFETPNQ